MKLLALFLITWIAGAAGFSIIGSGFTFFQGKPNHKKPSSLKNSPPAAAQVSGTSAVTAVNAILNPFASAAKAGASAAAAIENYAPEMSPKIAPTVGKLSARPESSSVGASATTAVPALDATASIMSPKVGPYSYRTSAKVGAAAESNGHKPAIPEITATDSASISSKLNTNPEASLTANVGETDGYTGSEVDLNLLADAVQVGANAVTNIPKVTVTPKLTLTDSASIAGNLSANPGVTLMADLRATNVITKPKAGINLIDNTEKKGASARAKVHKTTEITEIITTDSSPILDQLNVSHGTTPSVHVGVTASSTDPKVGPNLLAKAPKLGATAETNVPTANVTPKITSADMILIADKLYTNPSATSTAEFAVAADITRSEIVLNSLDNAKKLDAAAGVNVHKTAAIPEITATDSSSIRGKLNIGPEATPTTNVEITTGSKGIKSGLNQLAKAPKVGTTNVPKANGTPKITSADSVSMAGKLNTNPGEKTTPNFAATADIPGLEAGHNLLDNATRVNQHKTTAIPEINAAGFASMTFTDVEATSGKMVPEIGVNLLQTLLQSNFAKMSVAAVTKVSKATATPKMTSADFASIAGKLSANPGAIPTTDVRATLPLTCLNPRANATKVGDAAGSPKISVLDFASVVGKPYADSETAAGVHVDDIATITSSNITFNSQAISEAKFIGFSKINTNNSGSITSRIGDSLKATTKVSASTVPAANLVLDLLATTLNHEDISTTTTVTPKYTAIPKTTAADFDLNMVALAKTNVSLNYTGAVSTTTTEISVPNLNTATVVKSNQPHNSLTKAAAKYSTARAVADSNATATSQVSKLRAHRKDVAITAADIILNPLITTVTTAKAITATDMTATYPALIAGKLNHEGMNAKIGSTTAVTSGPSTIATVKNDTKSRVTPVAIAPKHDTMSTTLKDEGNLKHSVAAHEDTISKNTVKTYNVQSSTSATDANSSVKDEVNKNNSSFVTMKEDHNKNFAAIYDVKATTTASKHDSNIVVINSKKRVESNYIKTVVKPLVTDEMKYEDTTAIAVTETNIVTTPTVAANVVNSNYNTKPTPITNTKTKNDVKKTVSRENNVTKDNIFNYITKPAPISDSKQDFTNVVPKTMNLDKVTLGNVKNKDDLAVSTATTKSSITTANVGNTSTIFVPKTTPPSVVLKHNAKSVLTMVKNDLNSEVIDNPAQIFVRPKTTTAIYGNTSKVTVTTQKYEVSTEDFAPKIGTTTINESKTTTAFLDTSDKYHATSKVASGSSKTTAVKNRSLPMGIVAKTDSKSIVTVNKFETTTKHSLNTKVTKVMNVANHVEITTEDIKTQALFVANDGSPSVSSITKYDEIPTATEDKIPLAKNVAKFIYNPIEYPTKSGVEDNASFLTPSDKYDISAIVTSAENITISTITPAEHDSRCASTIIKQSKNVPNSLKSDAKDATTSTNHRNSPAVDAAKFNISTKHSANSRVTIIKSGNKPSISTSTKPNIHHDTGTKVITIPVVTTAKKCTQSLFTSNKQEQLASSNKQCEPYCPCCTGCTNIANPVTNEKTTVIAIIRDRGTTNVIVILTK